MQWYQRVTLESTILERGWVTEFTAEEKVDPSEKPKGLNDPNVEIGIVSKDVAGRPGISNLTQTSRSTKWRAGDD